MNRDRVDADYDAIHWMYRSNDPFLRRLAEKWSNWGEAKLNAKEYAVQQAAILLQDAKKRVQEKIDALSRPVVDKVLSKAKALRDKFLVDLKKLGVDSSTNYNELRVFRNYIEEHGSAEVKLKILALLKQQDDLDEIFHKTKEVIILGDNKQVLEALDKFRKELAKIK